MILVKDVNIISIDGANDITVSTNKIFNVPDRLVDSPSKFNENPVPSVSEELCVVFSVVAETVLTVDPVIKIMQHNTSKIFAIIDILFAFFRII